MIEVLVRHSMQEVLLYTGQYNIQATWQAHASMFRAEATSDPSEAELPTKIPILENEIAQGDYDLANKIRI